MKHSNEQNSKETEAMISDTEKEVFILKECDPSDMADDDEDLIEEEVPFTVKPWFLEKEKEGYTFRGKHKKYIKAVENIKLRLKRGFSEKVNNIDVKVVDSKKIPHGIERDIELTKQNESGKAKLKIYDQNAKKKHISLVVNRSKESEVKFLDILANDVVKVLLDNFISGEGWAKVLNNTQREKETNGRFMCIYCTQIFVSSKNLQTHKKKFHQFFQTQSRTYTWN